MAAYDVEPGLHLLSRRRKERRDPREFASRRRRARPLPALSPARCGRPRLLQRPHPARTQEPDRVRSRALGRTHARHAACRQSGGRQSAPGGRPRPPARSTKGLGRALLGGGSARLRLPSRFAQAGGPSQPARAHQASPRPQSSAKAENLRTGNPALPHRFRRALHQQPGRTGPQDDEGQNENLRLVLNPRRRSNLRPPQIRRLDREKTRPQHPPNPHRNPGSDHESPRRIAGSLGVTSESPAGLQFLAFTTATGLSRYKDVPWPNGLAPKTGPAPSGAHDDPLPRADVLVVTWTVDEGHALSRVLTPGKDSHNDYFSYTHNFASLSQKMRKGCPALEAKRLGAYWTTTIGKQSVVLFKSDSHMSQDGPELPNIDVWTQIIEEAQPKLVITTGTAGGIGKEFEVGDVIVSPIVRFDCTSKFKKEPFAQAHYQSWKPNAAHFRTAKSLFKLNAPQLPKDNTRLPKIVQVATTALESSVVTTDFFGFDTSDDHY